jgi:hypothetical protein
MNFLDRKLLKAIELDIDLKRRELEKLEKKQKAFLTEIAEKKYPEFQLVVLERSGKIERPESNVSLNQIYDICSGTDANNLNGFVFDEALMNILHIEKNEHDGLEKVYSDYKRSYEVRKVAGNYNIDDAPGIIIRTLNVGELCSLDEILVTLSFVVGQIKNGKWPLAMEAVCLGYFKVVDDVPLAMILTCVSDRQDGSGYGFWKIHAPMYAKVSHYSYSSYSDIALNQRKFNVLIEK